MIQGFMDIRDVFRTGLYRSDNGKGKEKRKD